MVSGAQKLASHVGCNLKGFANHLAENIAAKCPLPK